MRQFRYMLITLVGLTLLTACDAFRTLTSGDSTTSLGKPYELIVVCNQQEWTGAVGDTLRSLFQAPVAYINQDEPLFELQRVTERGFTQMVIKHRNILIIKPTREATEARATVKYDLRSQPQIEVTLAAPSVASIQEYLNQNGDKLVAIFEIAERDRAVAYAAKFNEPHIESVINKTFGISMNVPKGYVLAKQEGDFVWCRYEYPEASQGFCIYSYPYQGKGSLSEASLLAARNKFVNKIPGPTEGSHMTTSPSFTPDFSSVELGGRKWIEMRGFWDVEGDFMGGPMVSYTTYDKTTGQIITLDCYIFSPKKDKRNYLRGVEHLLHMISLPAPAAQ